MRRSRQSRGLTLFEAIATAVVVSVLAAVSVVAFTGSQERTQSSADTARLTALQAAGRSVVALSGSTVPLDIVDRLPADGVKIVSGPSSSGGEVSVARLSSTRIAYVVVDGEGCQGIIDDVANNVTMWISDENTDPENCNATRLGLTAVTDGTSLADPTTFDFDSNITVPGAPAAPTVAVSGSTALVSFYAPRNNGGSAITEYTVTCAPNGNGVTEEAVGARSPLSITGLTAGELYTCTVKAANVRGYGDPSQPSDEFRPVNPPNAPTGVSAEAGDRQATIRWTKLTSATDAPVAGYRVYANGTLGCQVVGADSQSCVAAGLTNGTSYTIQVVAYFETTEGVASSPVIVVPRRTPGAPTNATVALSQVAGSTVAEVNFNEPADDGGSIITGYRAICISSNGGVSGQATSLSAPAVITGLTTGKAYTCTVAAQNDAGYGDESAPTASFVSAAPPGAPTAVSLVGSSTTVTLSFTAPVSTGGLPISLYRATCSSSDGGAQMVGTATASPVQVQSLTAGKSYTCTVAAQNAAGYGPESQATPAYVAYNIPGTVTGLTATPSNQRVTLTWSPLTTTTADPVEGYRVYRNGVLGCQITGATSTSCAVTGLTNGTSYSFQVLAYYSTVEGALSSAVVSTPLTNPAAPTGVSVVASQTTVTVSFTPPTNNGGATITSYRGTCVSSNGGLTVTGTAGSSPVTVSGLSAAKLYTCTVAAQNAAGWSVESAASSSFTPISVPDAPMNPSVLVDKTAASVSFVPPAFNGGATITAYRVTCSSPAGGTTKSATGAASPITVTGLTAAKSYTCTVAAQNSQGWSVESSQSTAFMPYTTPGAPENVDGLDGIRSIKVFYTPPTSDGGSTVLEYRVTCTNTVTNLSATGSVSGATLSINIEELTPGELHSCTAAARNAAGWSAESAATTDHTPYDVPDAPVNVTASANTTEVNLTFAPGASENGRPITRFRGTCVSSDGGVEGVGYAATSPVKVTDLTAGKTYTCTVAAENLAGWSAESSESEPTTPYTVPDAPTAVTAELTRGLGAALNVTGTPGDANGRSINTYRATCTTTVGTTVVTTVEAPSLPVKVQNLAPGSVVACTLAAKNLAGWSAESDPSEPVEAYPAPGTPLVPSVVPFDGRVEVFWTPSQTTDSTPITGYRIYITPQGGSSSLGCQEPSADGSYCEITGLTNGTTYTFNLVAYFSTVESEASEGVEATPRRISDAPANVVAVYGDMSATLTWGTFFNGGAAISDYLVEFSTDNGSTWTPYDDGVSAPGSIIVSGLTNGTSYVFRLAATNVAGTSAWSDVTNAVVPKRPPNAPTNVTGEPAGSGKVSLQWVAPTDLGGVELLRYELRESSNNGSTWSAEFSTGSPNTGYLRTGLTDGQTYLFQIRAVNAAGPGPWSQSSPPINTIQPPDPPANLQVFTSSTEGSATWDAVIPSTIKPLTGYRLLIDGVQVCQTADTTCTFSGLVAGQTYQFSVAAYGTAGQGNGSTPQAITTLGVPTSFAATWQTTSSMQLSWVAPVGTGNTPITRYQVQYRISGAAEWTSTTTTSTSLVLQDLSVGQPYEVRVAAENAVGVGTYTTAAQMPAPVAPSVPQNLTMTASYGEVSLTWTAPTSNGGLPITDYEISVVAPDGTGAAGVSGLLTRTLGSTGTSFTFTGLTNGYNYVFRVGAVNGVGTGALASTTTVTIPYVPIGSVVAYVNADTPSGWVLADGTAISRSSYAQLFAAVGSTYGAGNGSTTFNVPDLRGRTLVAQDPSQALFDGRGETGGELAHALTSAEIPSHVHGASHGHGTNDPGHGHGQNADFTVAVWWGGGTSGIPAGWSSWANVWGQQWWGSHWFTIYGAYANSGVNTAYASTATTGAGWAHSELQPYTVVRYLIAADQNSRIQPGMIVQHSGWDSPSGWSETTTLRGRVPVGQHTGQGEFDVLGETGGSKTVAISWEYLPNHNHDYSHGHSLSDPSHGHGNPGTFTVAQGQGGGSSGIPAWLDWSACCWGVYGSAHWFTLYGSGSGLSSQTAWTTTGNAGSSSAHNNIQAYFTNRYLTATSATARLAPGMLLGLAGTTAPSSMPEANGQAISRTTYAAAFNVIGGGYGAGNGSTTFNLPNVRGRIGVGYDSTQTEFNAYGKTGGANTATIDGNQLATHLHDMSHNHSMWDNGHGHDYNGRFTIGYAGGGGSSGIPNGWSGGWGHQYGPAHWWTVYGGGTGASIQPNYFNTGGAGSGSAPAHNNVQPYLALPVHVWTGATETLAQLPAPANLTATASSTDANVSWSAVSSQYSNPVVGYRVLRDGVVACQTTLTSCSISGLTAGTAYSLQVAAYGIAGQGALSAGFPITSLGVPTSVSTLWETETSFVVTWAAPTATGNTPITTYIVEHKPAAESSWTAITGASSPTTVTVAGFGSYDVRVRAVNAVGTGSPSAVTTASTPSAPSAVQSISNVGADSSVRFTWAEPATNGNARVTAYVVEVLDADGGQAAGVTGADSRTTPAPTTSYTFTGLTNGFTYKFRVAARNAAGTGPFADVSALQLQALPAGLVAPFASSTVPAGWLEAAGQAVSRSTYADLFAVIGTQYGAGDGSTTFNLPDMRGLAAVQLDAAQTEFDVLGETGGTRTEALTQAQMPSHTHVQTAHNHVQDPHTHTQNGHNHNLGVGHAQASISGTNNYLVSGYAYGRGDYYYDYSNGLSSSSDTGVNSTDLATNNATTATNDNTGSGTAHNNLQPYVTLRYLISATNRTAVQPGMVLANTATAASTPGWSDADGQALSRSDFAALFSAAGTAFGAGNGSTTFNVPDMRMRIPVGLSSAVTEFDTLGETGGTTDHTLSVAELPSHTHTQSSHNHGQLAHSHTANAHSHNLGVGHASQNVSYASNYAVSGYGYWNTYDYFSYNNGLLSSSSTATNNATTATNQSRVATNQNTGSSQSHSNLQPYVTYRYSVAADSTSRLLPGMVSHYASDDAVSTEGTTGGWLAANGQAVSRTANSALFAAVGSAYGSGDGTTTFNLPTSAGRVIAGLQSTDTRFDALGETGGSKTVTLTEAQMASHTHTQPAHNHTQNAHNHTQSSHVHNLGVGHANIYMCYCGNNYVVSGYAYGVYGNYYYNYSNGLWSQTVAGTNQTTAATTDPATPTNSSTGGSAAHNEIQPYRALNLLIHGGSVDNSQVKPSNTYAAPAGTVAWYAGTTPPSGWLAANGQAVSRLTYSTLFGAVGTTYGAGNGAGTFNVPNVTGRSIFARDAAQTEFDTLGETGGSKTAVLTIAQLPSHTHSQPSHNHSNTVSVGSHSHSYGQEFGNSGDSAYPPASGAVYQWGQYCCYSGVIGSTTVSVGINNAAATATNQSTGGGQSHTNLQPYITLTPIVATGNGSAFEPGMVIATTAATTPAGWLEANGQTVSRSVYPALFGVSGTQFGTGDGSTTFGLPDTRGRVVIGVDAAQTEFDVLGETGGAKTAVLTQAQMPSHTHTQNAHTHNNSVWSGSHSHNVGLEYGGAPWAEYNPNGTLAQWGSFYQDWRIDAAATPVSISNATAPAATSGATGSGAAHTNIAPYQAVRYLVATSSRLDLQTGMLLNVAATAAPSGSYTAGVSGRSLVGVSASDTEWDVLGETGGTKSVALSAAEMPSHTHTMDAHSHANSVWAANHSHSYGVGFGRPGSLSFPPNGAWGSAWGQYGGYSGRLTSETFGFYISNAAADVANQNTGSGSAHNNLQPYITLQSWSFNKALLTAVASSTSATLSWEPTASALRAGVAGYRVFRDGVQVCQTTATTCTVSGLTAGTSYTWQVAPISGAGQGELSTALQATTLSLATGVTATVSSAGNVALSWTAPASNGGSAVVSYDYRYSTDGGATWTTPVNTASVAASSALSSLNDPKAYVFQIRPVNGVGAGTWSTSSAPVVTIEPTLAAYGARRANILTQPSFEFATVSGFTATATVKDRSTEQARSGSASWKTTMSSTTDSNVASVNAGTVTVPQAGTYTVSAYFFVPAGSPLAGRTVTLSAETGTTASYANGASYPATLVAGSWVRASRTIAFASVPATHPMLVGRISGDLTAAVGSAIYTDDWLYESAAAAGPYFDGASTNGFWTGTPHNSTSQHAVGDKTALLAWDPPIAGGSIADYAVQFRTAGGTWAAFDDGVSSAQTASVTGLTNLTTYEFRVAAVSGGAQGLWSNVVSATPNDLPSQPLAPVAEAGATSAVVSWTAPQYLGAGSVEYEVSVWDSTGNTAGLATNAARLTGSTALSYTFTGLQQGEQYTFKVRTKNAAGFSGYSTTSNVAFLALIPVGTVVPFAGSSIPDGWLEANGQAVSRSTYAQLYGSITTTYGAGDGSTTFNLPDMRTRTAVMTDGTQTEFDVLGETGGTTSLALSQAQLPSHTHGLGSYASSTAGNHDHRAGVANGFAGDLDIAIDNSTGSDGGRYSFSDSYTDASHPSSYLYADSQGAHSHTFSGTTATTGAGTAHNELQPYLTLRYIVATTDLGALPAGSLVASASSSTPSTWLLADGSPVSRSTYATLFSRLGDAFGAGDGSTTFLLPNTKSRVIVGRDATNTQFDTLGETGGSLTHTLTQDEMPSHTHAPGSLASNSLGAHTHTMRMSSGSFAADLSQIAMSNGSGSDGARYAVRDSYTDASHPNAYLYARSNGGHTHAVTGTSAAAGGTAGAATAHENTQPYVTTRWLVATTDTTVPVGAMLYSASAATTPGWLETAGTAVSRTTHAGLFSALGTTYGAGDGSTTFNLPNARGRAAVGLDAAQTAFDTVGETGGSKTVTLALAQVPSHTHAAGTLALASGGAHTHNIRAAGSFAGDLAIAMTNNCCSDGARYGMGDSGRDASWPNSFMYAQATGDHTHTLSGSTASAGSDAAHSNLQPYTALVQMVYSGAVVTGAPAAPFGVSATAAANQVTVSWSAVTDNSVTPLTGYRVFRGGVQICQVAKPTVSCVDSAISGGVTYSYQVAAYGANGQGSMSYAVTATPWTAPSAPSITSTTADAGGITITFSAAAANGATVTAYQYSLSGGGWTNFANTNLTQSITGLSNGTSYTVKVRGVNSAGGGAESNTVSATPFTVPNAPNVSVSGGHDRSLYTSWSANWNGGSGITSYNVDISSDGSNWSRWLTNTGATGNWYGGLARTPTTYWFRVQANNARGSSAWSTGSAATGWSSYIGYQEGFYVGWWIDGRTGYSMVLQGDNNLVQYSPWGARWVRSQCVGSGGSYLGMQGDQNLVLYCLPAWNAGWASSFEGSFGASFKQESDGFLCLKSGWSGDGNRNRCW